MLESVFEGLQIVEFDNARGFGGIHWGADIAAARAYYAIVKRYESFIYRAVIAAVEDENFGALRDFAGNANGETVGVGGGERELPVGQAKSALEIFTDPERVLGGKHESDALADTSCDGVGDDWGRVTSHGTGVAEAEVNVVVAVNVGEVRTAGGLYEDGEGASPFVHPVHGNAAEERRLGAKIELGGARMLGDEAFFFALMERVEFDAVDGSHGD
jgi:hypothetical protein